MANDAVSIVAATTGDVTDKEPVPFQDCRDVVHLAMFFDGTGNNWEKDVDTKSWSNVGRMYDAAIKEPSKSTYAVYVAGVGTPYNGEAANWLSSAFAWTEDKLGGLAFGAGGTRRLRQGDDAVNDRLKQVLIANAQAAGGEVAKYAASATEKGFDQVNAVLGKHRLIKVINMSFFGFSRGAALARAFSNRVIGNCKESGTDLLYEGYKMHMPFMGIFDTVASFGVPAQNVRLPFEERELIVSGRVQRCVHYVAAHEVRFAFPVDLIRKDGKLAGEWDERVYPGVHSDVGGGYEPDSQGISDNYSRIPMREMMKESATNNARIFTYEQIEKDDNDLFLERFICKEDTQTAYNNYIAACGAMSGTIENQMKRHLQVYYSANGTMHRRGIVSPGQRRRAEDWTRRIGPVDMAREVERYREAARKNEEVRVGGDEANSYAQYIKAEEWQLSAWDEPATDGAVDFVSRFVHDSKVDFVMNAEPFSYFRPRGVQESSISIWAEWGNWIGRKRDAAVRAVSGAFATGKREVGEAVDATTDAAKSAVDAGRQKAEEAAAAAQRTAEAAAAAAQRTADAAARYARQKADEATAAAERAYDATAKTAREVADAAQLRAEEAAAFARRQAQTAASMVKDGYDAATDAAQGAAAAGGRKIGEVTDGAEQLYDQGVNWVKRTVTDTEETH